MTTRLVEMTISRSTIDYNTATHAALNDLNATRLRCQTLIHVFYYTY
jgi:hypothetical protein